MSDTSADKEACKVNNEQQETSERGLPGELLAHREGQAVSYRHDWRQNLRRNVDSDLWYFSEHGKQDSASDRDHRRVDEIARIPDHVDARVSQGLCDPRPRKEASRYADHKGDVDLRQRQEILGIVQCRFQHDAADWTDQHGASEYALIVQPKGDRREQRRNDHLNDERVFGRYIASDFRHRL